MNLTVDDITFGYDSSRNVLEHLSFTYESPEVLNIAPVSIAAGSGAEVESTPNDDPWDPSQWT